MHGGKTPIKSGLYSKYAMKGLAEKIEEASNDKKLTDVRALIAVQASLMNSYLEKYKFAKAIGQEEIEVLMTISDTIGKNIERLNKIENGETFNVKIDVVQRFVLKAFEIIKIFIPDAKTREACGAALMKAGVA